MLNKYLSLVLLYLIINGCGPVVKPFHKMVYKTVEGVDFLLLKYDKISKGVDTFFNVWGKSIAVKRYHLEKMFAAPYLVDKNGQPTGYYGDNMMFNVWVCEGLSDSLVTFFRNESLQLIDCQKNIYSLYKEDPTKNASSIITFKKENYMVSSISSLDVNGFLWHKDNLPYQTIYFINKKMIAFTCDNETKGNYPHFWEYTMIPKYLKNNGVAFKIDGWLYYYPSFNDETRYWE